MKPFPLALLPFALLPLSTNLNTHQIDAGEDDHSSRHAPWILSDPLDDGFVCMDVGGCGGRKVR